MDVLNIVRAELAKKFKNLKTALFGTINSVIKNDNSVYVGISPDEELRDVSIVSPYGIYSLPSVGSMGQVIFNNSTKKAVLIGVVDSNKKPVEIDIGEVMLYNSNAGTYILLSNDGKIRYKGEMESV